MKSQAQEKIKLKSILLITIMLILTLLGTTLTLSETHQDQQDKQKLLYLTVEKPYYGIGEKISLIITAEPLSNYELSISSPSNYYKYSGELKGNIEFYPKEEGVHTVELVEKQSRIFADSIMLMISLPAISQPSSPEITHEGSQEQSQESSQEESQEAVGKTSPTAQNSNALIWTDKQQYLVGEPVISFANVIDQSLYKLYYEYSTFTQRYMGDFTQIRFVPRGLGNHSLVLKDANDNEVERASFEVIENIRTTEILQALQAETKIIPQEQQGVEEKDEQEEKDETLITGKPPDETESSSRVISLVNSKKSMEKAVIRFYGLQQEEINLDDILIGYLNKTLIEQLNKSLNEPLNDSLNETLNTSTTGATGIEENFRIIETVEIIPEKRIFSKLVIRKLLINASQNISLGIDEVPTSKISIGKENIVKAFAVDPSSLSFTNGTLTSTAKGSALWKCREWDFENQECLGSWQKVMDLTPGQEYEVEISPEDPGFAETGLASINTKKPIYHPNETAEIIIVVLDTKGHLVSNANISLEIITPDNQTATLTTGNGEITGISRGIYEAVYDSTALEGDYPLIITATAENTNSTMRSYFVVKEYYEFDILRSTPAVTDPWRGAFDSSIRIISYINANNTNDTAIFNFTEALPESFEIINAGGATITTANGKTYLSWANLSNNSIVSYSALPPLITPELYELGPSVISYDNPGTNESDESSKFYEARPWYLAVDPSEERLPDSNGNYQTWGMTGCASTYQCVDDPVGSPDDATTYLTSPDNTNRNSFGFDNLSKSGVIINWVSVSVRARRQGGAGTATLQIFYRQGGTDYDNANTQALGTSWTNYSLAGWNYTTNPATGAAWNESAINNMEWGVGRSAATNSRRAWVTQMYITVSYNESNNPPNITALNNPGNNTNITSSSIVQFNFTVRDDTGFRNCTLYTNHTGSWAPNLTRTNINNNTVNNITVNMPDGNIRWNVICWDNATIPLSDWYDYNYTVHIDTTGPNMTIDRPANGTNITSSNYTLNASVSDLTGIDTVTFLYRQNSTASWQAACTDNRGPSYDCEWDLSSLPDGNTYEVRAYANDTYGHMSNNDTRYNITVDRNGPSVTLDKPENSGTVSGTTYVVNATATDTPSGVISVLFEYRENSSESWKSICEDSTPDGTTYSCDWDLTGLSEQSTYEVKATANDTLGNSNSDTHTNIIVTKAPDITDASANPENVGIGQPVLLNASITDSNGISSALIIITTPDNENETYPMSNSYGSTYEYTYTPLMPGTYKYTIVANDTQGNQNILDPYFYVHSDATVHVLAANESYLNDQDVNLTLGYVNLSSDQESGTRQLVAQGMRSTTFLATGSSFIGADYDVTSGSYTDTQSDNGAYLAVGRENSDGWGITNDNLRTYINLSYNISSINVSSDKIDSFAMWINFCHSNDITPPITCGGSPQGTPNNPVDVDIYNFGTTSWATFSSFNQYSNNSEQTRNFSASSGFTNYVSNGIVYNRFETDFALDTGEDASFAIDLANLTVNYTKLDNEGSSDYVNYTSIGGSNLPSLTGFDVIIGVSYYNASGSLEAGNSMPDLQVYVYDGSSYIQAGNCSMHSVMGDASSTLGNCTLTITDQSIINTWKNNTSARRIQVRGINFDEENGQQDRINFTAVNIKYLSGSLIANHDNYTVSGYLVMMVEKNNSGSFTHVETIVNDSDGGSARNISAYTILEIGSIWNSDPFNTNSYDPGSYRINARLTDINGTVLSNDDGTQMIGYDSFSIDYIKINTTSPQNNSEQNAEGFDANITLSYFNYGTGGMCYYSIDGGTNITMQNITSSFYHNITRTDSLGSHSIRFYCNDTRGYWFSSPTHYFNATDQRGPVVNLESPENNRMEPDGDITFYYNVSDALSGIQNCTLIIDYTNRVNTSYNVTENTTLNFTVTGLSYENHVWQVICYDNSSNNNQGSSPVYKFLVGNDTSPPDITLKDPEPGYSTTTPTLTFSYTVIDSQSDIANCSLIINGTTNQTNTTILTGITAVNYYYQSFSVGSYNWSVNCTDIRGNTGASTSRIFSVLNDTDYPVVTLISPAPSSINSNGNVIFTYNVTDASSGINNCSLILNNNINQTNSSITEGVPQYFYLYGLAEGNYNWSINCTDGSANYNKNDSETWNFTVSIVSDIAVKVTSDKAEYQTGENAQINTTVKDLLNNNLAADVITDIIRGNATVPWWNTSWDKRKPIILSSSSSLTNALVEVNISGLSGNISSCQNEIRIVKNDSSNELVSINRTIVGGDNANYCIVRFRANITAGANNTQFYAYYNNSAAPNPANNEARENRSLVRTANSGSLISSGAGYNVNSGSYSDTTSDNSVYYAVGRDNTDGWGGSEDDLQAYINLSYNITSPDLDEGDITSINASINFCHTNDVTAPITCSGGASGSPNNAANVEFYDFGSSSWTAFDSFTQNAGSAAERNLSFLESSSLEAYVRDSKIIWVRYETDFALAATEDAAFAIDYAYINVSYMEKVHTPTASIGSTHVFVARQNQSSITAGLATLYFNTSSYTEGTHSAVSKANLTDYHTTFNHTFFNIIIDVYGPNITLISPPNNNYSMARNVTFIYTANDAGNSIASCSLIINNELNQTNHTVAEGVYQYFYLHNLPDGDYNWSINCTDTIGNQNASEKRNLTIGGDIFPPEITLYRPANNTPFLSGSTITFNYSVIDTLNSVANCSLTINGSVYNTTNNPAMGVVLNFTTSTLGNGNYSWSINCTDNSTNNNIGSSETRNFSIGPDNAGPVVGLKAPPNGGQADNGNVTFVYNVSDFLSGISNCTISVYNSSLSLVFNSTNTSVQESANQYFYAYNLYDGLHYWNISCWDNAATPNQGFSATWNFTIASDTTKPIVHILSPPDGYQDVDGNVTFYFNVSEDITPIANCSLIFNGSINTTKNSSEITNNAINNFTLYNMGVANYLWKVNCSDSAALGSNIGTSPEEWLLIVAPDTAGPVITLFSPPNAVQDTDGIVYFEFNASDYASGIINCSLVFNNTINYTWHGINESQHYNYTMPLIPNGNYTWYVNCTDDSLARNIGRSEIRNLTIGSDSLPPTVNLISPPDDTKNTNGDITFIYNVSDYASNITNCSLIIDGVTNHTNTSITEDTNQYFYLYGQNDTQFDWRIDCTDNAPYPNTGSSETRNITVVLPKPLITQITTDNTSYIQGQTVKVTANTTNVTGSLINTSIRVDIVRGDGMAPWWGTSWKYRVPVELGTGNYSREYYLAEQEINFTSILVDELNITGKSLDINSIRVVEWEPDNDSVEIESVFMASPDFNASSNAKGMVSWIIKEALANTTKHYYVYFDTTDNPKSAPSYSKPNYTFVGSGKNVNFDGSTTSRNYLVISSGDESFAVQFADGDNLPNQHNIKYQGSGAIWNISVNSKTLTNPNSSITPISVAINDWLTASSTSNVTSGPITRIYIPGEINTVSPSSANLSYLVWFSSSEIFVKANLTAYFGSGENNNYAIENAWFAYLFDDDNNTGWTDYINRMESQSKNQTHDYQGVQENTFNSFYPGNWYMEHAQGLGAIGLVADTFKVNSADATKGIVTFDAGAGAEETDMVGFSGNGNPDIMAGDVYELVVWMVFTSQADASRISSLKDQIENPASTALKQGEEFITRSSGTSSNGFYYYNFSTAGQRMGDYSAISWAYREDFVNASAYTWFNITPDTIPPTVTLARPEGWLNYDDVNFTYYIAEGGSGIYDCSLYINGVLNQTRNGSQITDYANNTFNITNMSQGSYNWTVVCYDNNFNNGTDDAFNITIDITAPNVTINGPEPGAMIKDSTPLFNLTIKDNLANQSNYTVYVNGAPNGQNGTAANNTPVLLNLTSLSDGVYNITIKGTDLAGNSANATVQVTIDTLAPIVNFETRNGTWFNDSTPPISFNISDAVDTNINYTAYVNGSFDQSGNTPRNTSTTINLSNYNDGRYNMIIQATDDANNSANYSIIIYIDTAKPSINLTYPEDRANFTTSSLVLNFTVTDNLDHYLVCNLTIDGVINRSNFEVQSGNQSSTSISGLAEGTHYWNVTCWDNATNTNTSETRSFNIFTPPRVNLTFPPNGNVSNNPNQAFYFNVSDETGIYNCSLVFNGVVNATKPGSQIINNATNNFTVNNMNGTYNWSVRCYDNSTLYMQGNSENWTITIDLDAPYPVINTPSHTWFNTSTPLINFTITDNYDQLINYTFYANGSANKAGAVNNNIPNTTNLLSLSGNSSFLVLLQGTDDAGNSRNSTSIIIYVDTVKPSITLSAPSPGHEFNNTVVQFNFTATDNMAPYVMCNLTISNGMYEHNINASSGVLQSITKPGFVSGTYWWNASCVDLAGNRNTSETRNFTILAPDLEINSANIWFNDSAPAEGSNITVYANVYNLGGSPATNLIVQFWRGDPDSGGTQVNGNLTIATLTNGQNYTFNITYTTEVGENSIYVVVDPPTASNGSIIEENESNNKAYRQVLIALYQVYAGNTTELIELQKQSINISMYQWNVSNATGSNIFVTDLEASPDFNSLQAIGRDTGNASSSNNDFVQIDTALGSTGYNDSINITYTRGGVPKATRTFNVFTQPISNVPIVNSTNTSSFVTGILWDKSDGGAEYNGTQDIVFITEINKQQQGSMGVYDFEIKVPALLRNYNAVGTTVAFYYELK